MTLLDVKKNFIIDAAIAKFTKNTLNSVTVKDIAAAAGIGEVTVYRYFGTKSDLIAACAEKLEKEVYPMFFDVGEDGPAIKKLEHFYSAYLRIFSERTELYRFLNEFDAYILREGIPRLDEYEDAIDAYREAFATIYRNGLDDKSVKNIGDIDIFYFTTTHSLLSLCKKLSVTEPVIRQDLDTEKKNEVKKLIEIIMNYLTPDNTAV